MSEIKLLPCPLCGGEALECKTKIICKDCTCTVYGANLDKARKIWNTRKPMERILTRLDEKKQEYLEGFSVVLQIIYGFMLHFIYNYFQDYLECNITLFKPDYVH